jgi:hypothetical protein
MPCAAPLSPPPAKPTVRKTTPTPDRYVASDNAGLESSNKMWLERTPYNPEFHHLNQVRHGSWVFLPVIPNRLCRCIGDRATFDRGSEENESCGFAVTPGQRIPDPRAVW